MLPASIAFRESSYVSPYTTVAHVVAMGLFAGLIVMMDLRLMGLAFMTATFSHLQRRLFPLQMLGMGLAMATGLGPTFGDPLRFYFNVFFWTKLCMIALAGVNAWAFEVITRPTVPEWDDAPVTPRGAKLAGAVSLVWWSLVIIAGEADPLRRDMVSAGPVRVEPGQPGPGFVSPYLNENCTLTCISTSTGTPLSSVGVNFQPRTASIAAATRSGWTGAFASASRDSSASTT